MPGQMTTGAARVVDPVLTSHARGYCSSDMSRVGSILFPRAPVISRGAKIVRFGKEAFRKYNTRRAPGSNTRRMRVGYSDDSISLYQHALEGLVPREILEESAAIPAANLGIRAVNTPLDSIAREIEITQAGIAQNAANYDAAHKLTLAGGSQWSGDSSDPGDQMDTAHEAIRSTTARRGNVLVLGPKIILRARRHPKIVGQFYTGAQEGAQRVNDQQLAEYFNVRQVVSGDEVWLPESASDSDPFVDAWGNVAILAYVPGVSGDGDIEVPSYGYTYYLQGHPMVEQTYFDNNSKSWIYPVVDEVQPILTGMGAGYLFSDVLA